MSRLAPGTRRGGGHAVARARARIAARWRSGAQRGLLLHLLPLPLVPAVLVSLLRGDYPRLGAEVAALVLLQGGAVLARRGLRAEARLRPSWRTRARRPWKTAGALCLSAGAAVLAVAIGHPWPVALGFAVTTFAGFALAYGLDPLRARARTAGVDGYAPAEIEAELARAERAIARLEAARAQLGPGPLAERLARVAHVARELVALVAAEPRHLPRARRFLRVYLDGVQQVCDGLPRTEGRRPAALDARLERVLGTMEGVLAAQHERLLAGDVEKLDVQVEVLAHQLRREEGG